MRGEVVVVPFPFSDLTSAKNRPALILIDLPGPDAVLAAISSTGNYPHAISLDVADFQNGKLDHASFIHPTKLFTCDKSLISKVAGRLKETKRKEVVQKVVALLN